MQILYKIDLPKGGERTDKEVDYINNNKMYMLKNNEKNVFVIKSEVKSPIANVIIVPPYGKNAHGTFLLSYYLLQNNINVVRFDGVDNVGLSSGNILNYALGQLEQDLKLVVDEITFDNKLPLIILCMSLSFPVSLKFTTYSKLVTKVISIVGCVNVADTIERVLGKSLKCYYIDKDQNAPKIENIFGHNVLLQDFFDDAERNRYTNLEDTISFCKDTDSELDLIVAGSDEYVNINDVKKLRKHLNGKHRITIFQKATHEIGRSLSLKKLLAQKTVESVFDSGQSTNKKEACYPKLTEVIESASIESKYLTWCEANNNV